MENGKIIRYFIKIEDNFTIHRFKVIMTIYVIYKIKLILLGEVTV